MKSRLASRAHSFKENFLHVFGGHSSSPHSSVSSPGQEVHHLLPEAVDNTTGVMVSNSASAANSAVANSAAAGAHQVRSKKGHRHEKSMSKKTNSTDNIIDFVTTSSNTIADPRNTEVMVREVHLALRYFQDAVVKGTYELLPGCATVVLETILALQSYAMSRRDPRNKSWSNEAETKVSGKISQSSKAMCSAVAKLTQWADRVITDGCVDPNEDYVNKIIDPVRISVNALASNLNAISIVPKSTSFHNSLPDLASPERENNEKNKLKGGQPMSYVEPSSGTTRPPPLPPKSKSQSQSDDSIDPMLMSSSDASSAHVDWFSNPLFERSHHRSHHGHHHHHHHRDHHRGSHGYHRRSSKRSSRTFSENSLEKSAAASSSGGEVLDTTLPDFCQPQRMSVCDQSNVSYIDVSPNLSRDSFEFEMMLQGSSSSTGQGQPQTVPLATSSPRMTNHDNTSSSTSSDIPPVLPKKVRQPQQPQQTRKISTYDNVFLPNFPTFQGLHDEEEEQGDFHEAVTTPCPPPLPPKKKHIHSYMEIFGRSNTDAEFVHSLTQTKDLLEDVWQRNYHDYSYNSMSSQCELTSGDYIGRSGLPFGNRPFNEYTPNSFQLSGVGVRPVGLKTSMSSYALPPPDLPPPPPPPLLASSGMPPPFPTIDDEEDNQGDLDDDDEPTTDDIYPPALPPKRGPLSSRSWTTTSTSSGMPQRSLSHEERIIPIVIEAGVHKRGRPLRQESTSSVMSANESSPSGGVPTLQANPDKTTSVSVLRFSADSMNSSTSSSGLGTDIQSYRQSLPSPVLETSTSQKNKEPEESNSCSKLSKQASRKSSKVAKETSPSAAKTRRSSSKKKKNSCYSALGGSVMDQVDVRKTCLDMLVYTSSSGNAANDDPEGKNQQNRGKELLRAGSVDALIVLATQSVKNDYLYQEAFMATYRTFIPTHDLLEKLVQRFRKFNNRRDERAQQQMIYKRVAHCAFSLMVRVVDGLADCDFQDTLVMELLSDFIAELVIDSELILARALRTKFIQKYEDRKLRLLPELDTTGLSSLSNKPMNLLSFKSVDLAEQMTLLDAQLFLRLDSAELILWVQEQNEDKSPNLTKFTEHFNNMSFWCRTKILQQEDSKDREKLVSKFIKIMKELRKHNNFNSYLALLSALDSAPIRRLEWCKSITDNLKEHCALIDSSSSFRAYRQALSSASPPCIPYVGLVLQDLTFVQIGNPDTFDNKVNFAKRWQQFNILDNLMRFKKKTYPFERKEEIIHYFSDFDDYWTEDKMWSVSESLKPRGRRNVR